MATSKTSKTRSSSTKTKANSTRSPKTSTKSKKVEFDPGLHSEEFNETRRPRLPYGIIINKKPAGILIPTDQLEQAEWHKMPNEEQLHTVELTEEVTGLLLRRPRMLVLDFIEPYIRYKPGIPGKGGTIIGPYEANKQRLNKKKMDVCAEHAIVFLDKRNRPLHGIPIVTRFKNVSLWSFTVAREEAYTSLEKAWAAYHKIKFQGKNQKWRSLGVLEVEFEAVKEGKNQNKHYCCKVKSITQFTPENLPQLYLGTPEAKKLVWGQHDGIEGFNQAPALPAETSSEEEGEFDEEDDYQTIDTKAIPLDDDLDDDLDSELQSDENEELEEDEDFDEDDPESFDFENEEDEDDL